MQHAEEFVQAGLLFPKAGWFGVVPGQHAVAWELCSGDFSGPAFTAMIEEIGRSPGHACIISAEDFSMLAARPDGLAALKQAFASIGYGVKILAYVRPQAAYAESMYVERVKHDHIKKIDEYVNEIVETGRYTGSTLPIDFRYTRLLAPFEEVFGKENVIARPYLGSRDLSRIFLDFLTVIAGLANVYQDATIDVEIANPIVNESLTFMRLLGYTFTRLRPASDVPETMFEFAALYAPELPTAWFEQRFALFSREDYVRILESVKPDNRAMAQRYNILIPFVSEGDVPSPNDPLWEKARIERAIYDRFLETYLL